MHRDTRGEPCLGPSAQLAANASVRLQVPLSEVGGWGSWLTRHEFTYLQSGAFPLSCKRVCHISALVNWTHSNMKTSSKFK